MAASMRRMTTDFSVERAHKASGGLSGSVKNNGYEYNQTPAEPAADGDGGDDTAPAPATHNPPPPHPTSPTHPTPTTPTTPATPTTPTDAKASKKLAKEEAKRAKKFEKEQKKAEKLAKKNEEKAAKAAKKGKGARPQSGVMFMGNADGATATPTPTPSAAATRKMSFEPVNHTL